MTKESTTYRPEDYIRPTANFNFMMWLLLLGLPLFLLFLIYSKTTHTGDQSNIQNPPGMEQQAH